MLLIARWLLTCVLLARVMIPHGFMLDPQAAAQGSVRIVLCHSPTYGGPEFQSRLLGRASEAEVSARVAAARHSHQAYGYGHHHGVVHDHAAHPHPASPDHGQPAGGVTGGHRLVALQGVPSDHAGAQGPMTLRAEAPAPGMQTSGSLPSAEALPLPDNSLPLKEETASPCSFGGAGTQRVLASILDESPLPAPEKGRATPWRRLSVAVAQAGPGEGFAARAPPTA